MVLNQETILRRLVAWLSRSALVKQTVLLTNCALYTVNQYFYRLMIWSIDRTYSIIYYSIDLSLELLVWHRSSGMRLMYYAAR